MALSSVNSKVSVSVSAVSLRESAGVCTESGDASIRAAFTGFSFGVSPQETIKNSAIIAEDVNALGNMDFTGFSQLVPKIKNMPLPGRASHYKMAPELRIQTLENGLEPGKNPRKAGVMALFYPDTANRTHLLFILRKTYEGVHSNQIGFPGGKQEPADSSLLDTALRETEEEVGVERQRITVIRALSDLYIPPSNFEVRPFIGLYDKRRPFVAQESEVEALVEVPFSQILDDGLITSRTMKTSYSSKVVVPAFELGGYIVWGATAMMLSEIKELFKRVI